MLVVSRKGSFLLALLWVTLLSAGAWGQGAAAPTFEALAANYDYDAAAPLDIEKTTARAGATYTVDHLVFSSTNGERVTALVEAPKGDGPCPAVVVQHGLGGRKEDFQLLMDLMGLQGVGVIAIDAEFHGERKEADVGIIDAANWERSRAAMMQTVVDLRRAVDALLTYKQMDPQRIGFIGVSMGAILGTVFCAVEPRISCAVLIVGGADWGLILEKSQIGVAKAMRDQGLVDPDQVREVLRPVDPLYFVAHISPRPVLFQQGRQDDIVPVESNELLINTAGEPKEVDWYDSGHMVPIEKVIPRVTAWLKEKLKVGQ